MRSLWALSVGGWFLFQGVPSDQLGVRVGLRWRATMQGLGKSPRPLAWCTSLSMLVCRSLSNSPEASMGFALLKEQVHLLSLLRKGWHQLLRTFILVRSYFCNVTPGIGPILGAEQQRRVRWWPRDHSFCHVFLWCGYWFPGARLHNSSG